jgi:ABC-2 type transport system permease protein
VGVLFCCIFKSENLANKVLSPFINIFIIIGGVFFSVESLGKTMTQISNFSPLKWLNEAVFKIIYDKDLSYFMPAVIIIVFRTIVCLVLCKLTFKEEDYV